MDVVVQNIRRQVNPAVHHARNGFADLLWRCGQYGVHRVGISIRVPSHSVRLEHKRMLAGEVLR